MLKLLLAPAHRYFRSNGHVARNVTAASCWGASNLVLRRYTRSNVRREKHLIYLRFARIETVGSHLLELFAPSMVIHLAARLGSFKSYHDC
jgi:hypothetical protein